MRKIKKKKILILAANPIDTKRLRLDEEVREIENRLKLAKNRNKFIIKIVLAVRGIDFEKALLDFEPNIVHFCGHGEVNGIILEDETGKAVEVQPKTLEDLFGLFSKHVECVILNACFTETQAEGINRKIKYVIGMSKGETDKAAIEFAMGFYNGLGAERTIEDAFELGRIAIEAIGSPEYTTPVIKINPIIGTRIFISYKNDAEPDITLMPEVKKALENKNCIVFIDKNIPVGAEWAKRIDDELQKTDFFIVFLSENSIYSEMVQAEIKKAHFLFKEKGKPGILPVRIKYQKPFPYPIDAYLNSINWTTWDRPEDTPRLIQELIFAISGNVLPVKPEEHKKIIVERIEGENPVPTADAQPLLLSPGGVMDLESKFYIIRPADKNALEAIKNNGVTIVIKGPRQIGKSSLLLPIGQAAKNEGKNVIFIRFELFDKSDFISAASFYKQFCNCLSFELEIENKIDEHFCGNLPLPFCCTNYIQNYILKQIDGSIVIAMDEVEKVFDTDFRSEFFGMLRNWHNNRAFNPVWKRLDLVLVTSTEPYMFIDNLSQSPFNVGEVIVLEDFTHVQVKELNIKYGNPFTERDLDSLFELLHGHPYLVRKSMYLVKSKRYTLKAFFLDSTEDGGPFGDHLRRFLFHIYNRKDLAKRLREILRYNSCKDDMILWRLHGAGLIRREGKKVVFRCKLYKSYFANRL